MEQSTELKELYFKICEAISKGDYSFFEQQFSQEDGVLAIGSDPAEWWPGYSVIMGAFNAQLSETGGFQILADTPLAYSEGSIGWIAGRPSVKTPDGSEIPVRLTAVFRKEHGEWKIAQWHFSSGISNEDLIEETLTT